MLCSGLRAVKVPGDSWESEMGCGQGIWKQKRSGLPRAALTWRALSWAPCPVLFHRSSQQTSERRWCVLMDIEPGPGAWKTRVKPNCQLFCAVWLWGVTVPWVSFLMCQVGITASSLQGGWEGGDGVSAARRAAAGLAWVCNDRQLLVEMVLSVICLCSWGNQPQRESQIQLWLWESPCIAIASKWQNSDLNPGLLALVLISYETLATLASPCPAAEAFGQLWGGRLSLNCQRSPLCWST